MQDYHYLSYSATKIVVFTPRQGDLCSRFLFEQISVQAGIVTKPIFKDLKKQMVTGGEMI